MLWTLLLVPLVGLFLLWATAALWIDGPASRRVSAPLALLFAGGSGALWVWAGADGLGALLALSLCLGVMLWWMHLSPRSDREWERELSRVASAERDGDLLRFHHVRNFHYRSASDFDERWEERSFDLSRLRGMDLFLCYWGPRWIAHTIASWEFEGETGPEHLAISIEVRRSRGEDYSSLGSFFRRFELHYVVADERDVVRLRTNFRREDVYLYRLAIQRDTARRLLLEHVEEVNALVREPRWYHALTRNCTTAIRHHVKKVSPDDPWDWRILANGRLDELGYERGNIATHLPFAELRARSAISERARAAGDAADFPERIREGLPRP